MVEDSKQAAAAATTAQGAAAKVPIPISEPSTIHRRIQKAVFIDDVEAWVDRYGEEDLFAQMQELH